MVPIFKRQIVFVIALIALAVCSIAYAAEVTKSLPRFGFTYLPNKVIFSVVAGGSADEMGLKPSDKLISLNGALLSDKPAESSLEISNELKKEFVNFKVLRSSEDVEFYTTKKPIDDFSTIYVMGDKNFVWSLLLDFLSTKYGTTMFATQLIDKESGYIKTTSQNLNIDNDKMRELTGEETKGLFGMGHWTLVQFDTIFRIKPVNKDYSVMQITINMKGFNTWNGWNEIKSNGSLEENIVGGMADLYSKQYMK